MGKLYICIIFYISVTCIIVYCACCLDFGWVFCSRFWCIVSTYCNFWLWIFLCWSTSVAMCLHYVCWRNKVLWLVVSFYVRILFPSLCVIFELMFSRFIICLYIHVCMVLYFLRKQILLKFIFVRQCNSFCLQFI